MRAEAVVERSEVEPLTQCVPLAVASLDDLVEVEVEEGLEVGVGAEV